MPGRRDLLQPEGGTGRHRAVVASLQHLQTLFGADLPAAGSRYNHPMPIIVENSRTRQLTETVSQGMDQNIGQDSSNSNEFPCCYQ
jgi:hypothetical protein